MRVSVLGPLLVDDGRVALSRRDRVALTVLALQAGETVSGERLADALWGEEVPASWSKVVQGCIVRLRKALGPDAIDTDRQGYRLTIDPDDVDVRHFEQSLGRARELLVLGEPERAMYLADEALALWRGRPLAEVVEWEPARIEAERLDELRLEAEELRVDAALRAGRHSEVLAAARTGVDAAPTRERRWELLALAQYRAGRQADALRTLHTARRVLGEEVGIEPGPDLVALERAVLEQDPELSGPAAPHDAGTWCPWPGLLAYGVEDAEGFFGRATEVQSCLDRLAGDGVVVIVGASGSGKSSIARAGVAARFRRNGRPVHIIVPGPRPLDALSGVSGGDHAVLVVDQCEEVVTLCERAEERASFLDALVDHARAAPVLVTLRADHLADLSGHAGFAALVERGLFLLGPMDQAALRAAVEGPAGRAGLRLQPGLVDLVIREIQAEPGALPLLSHALHQTWVHREGRTMTVEGFRRTGGIAGAVAQSAEQVYADSGEADRSKLRELLVRMVVTAENGDPARVRLPRDVVAGDPGYERLVERLVAARLVTSDEAVVELAHEAVARAWPRLREWLDEDVEGIRVLRHLTSAAAGWDALGRPVAELYRGPRLAQVRAWRARASAELTPVERAFLEASFEAEEGELQKAHAQVRLERRSNRRLRRLVATAAVLTVIALLVSAVAFRERQRAEHEANVAEARRVAAEALVARPHDRALLLAVEAVRLWDSPETRGNLLTTIARSPNLTGVIRSAGPRLLDLELSLDGSLVAVTDAAGGLTVYDAESRTEAAALHIDGSSYFAPTFAPDGDTLVAAVVPNDCLFGPCPGSAVQVVDLARPGASTRSYEGAQELVTDLAISPGGDLVAAVPAFAFASETDNITVWRADRPDRPHLRLTLPDLGIELQPTPELLPPGWVTFSPDGSRLYASGAGRVAEFDLGTGELVRELPGLGALALSPDGATLALRTEDGGAELMDVETGEVRTGLPPGGGIVLAAAFSADGSMVATATTDESITLWDTVTGERVQELVGHAGSVVDVAFQGATHLLHSVAGDRGIFAWDPEAASLARRFLEGSPATRAETLVLVSPAADTMVVGSAGILRVDVGSGEVVRLAGSAEVDPGWTAYSPDGARLVAVDPEGATWLWDVDSGELIASAEGRDVPNFGAIAFSPDGSIVVADADGRVTELDGATLAPTGRSVQLDAEPAGIRAATDGTFAVTAANPDPAAGTEIVFGRLGTDRTSVVHVDTGQPRTNLTPDAARFAFGGFDGRVGVIDVATGAVRGLSDPVHTGPVAWVAFSPDGETVASLGFDGDLVLADARTGTPQARSTPGPVSQRSSMTFTPDGETIVMGYEEGSVVAFDVDSDAWLAHACRVAGRDLTAAEWRDAFGSGRPRRTCA